MRPEPDKYVQVEAEATVDTFAQAATGYPFLLDAVVLAGTHNNPKRLIAGRNKAFLKISIINIFYF